MPALLATLIVFLFPLIFSLSSFDIALRSIQYYRINAYQLHGNKKAVKLFSLLSSPERAISVLLFLRYTLTAVLYLIAGILIYTLPIRQGWRIALYPSAIFLFLILLEYIPRMLAVRNSERVAFALVTPFGWLLRLNRFLPLPQVTERIASALLRVYGFNAEKIFSEYSVNEIKMFLSLKRHSADPELKKQTIDSKFVDFSDRRVREVMVPRPFMKTVEINTPLRNLLKIIQENGYSRMPVYRNNLDNILGVLHVKDIIGATEPFSLESFVRRPFFVPETATVRAAFQNMQRNHSHLAIVVDEYGGVDGIVTLEDLIEQLIGEIQDEYDEEIQMLQRVSENTWMLEGNLPILELNQKLSLAIPESSSYTTIAGFLLSILDNIPQEKEQIRYGDMIFSIEKMAAHKIARVQVRLPQKSAETPH